MITKTYQTKSNQDKTAFLFESVGPRGSILKFVLLEDLGDVFNLAFGDVVQGQLLDSVTSNNQDIVAILSTVAYCVHEFLQIRPGSTIRIDPYDEKRRRLYNTIFQRKHREIEIDFEIIAVLNDVSQTYNPATAYDYFLLKHKI